MGSFDILFAFIITALLLAVSSFATAAAAAAAAAFVSDDNLQAWLGQAGLDDNPAITELLRRKYRIKNPLDILNSTILDHDNHVYLRGVLAVWFGGGGSGSGGGGGKDSLVRRWETALVDLNPHIKYAREGVEPWFPWNALLLNNQCSAIGLLQHRRYSSFRLPPQSSASMEDINRDTLLPLESTVPVVYSDYDTLQSVVVGRADQFQMPSRSSEPLLDEEDCFELTGVIENPATYEDDDIWGEGIDFVGTEYPADMIDAMNESLENLVELLESRGVQVLRSDAQGMEGQTPETGLKGHSARDLMIMIGNTLFLTPTPYRSRSHEVDEVYMDVREHVQEQGGKVIDLRSSAYWNAYKHGSFLRLPGEEMTDIPTTETVPLFDAANCFVLNEHVVVYLVSISGNRAGAELLQAHLAPMGMSVVVIEGIYYGSHIDTTILPLSRTKILFHEGLISRQQMEEIFSPHGYGPDSFIGVSYADFVPVDMELNNGASDSIAMNLLQVSPETVILEATQTRLAQILERHGFEVLMVPFPYARDFAGSLHCVTCPLHRGGGY